MITCPGCKNERIITDSESGEMICSSCGRVISDKLQDIDSEWHRYFIDESKIGTRIGSRSSLARHDMGLSTVIGKIWQRRRAATNLIQLCELR